MFLLSPPSLQHLLLPNSSFNTNIYHGLAETEFTNYFGLIYIFWVHITCLQTLASKKLWKTIMNRGWVTKLRKYRLNLWEIHHVTQTMIGWTQYAACHGTISRAVCNWHEMHGFKRMFFLQTNVTDKYKIIFASTFDIKSSRWQKFGHSIDHLQLFTGIENQFWFILQTIWELMVVLYASFSLRLG
jgi:hypothetical protein